MKKAKLTLTLNKETVANLNSNEMNEVKGGDNALTEHIIAVLHGASDVGGESTCRYEQ